MRQLLLNRRALAVGGFVLLAVASGAAIGVPLDDPGYLFYVPLALLALAGDTRLGTLAGLACAIPYTVATTRLGSPELWERSLTRFVAFGILGALIGWSAETNRSLLARLRDHAERDFLTGLLNMRAFEAALAARLERARPFALLLCDVDRLKDVNDSLGHAEGNELLKRVASTIDRTLAGDDNARLGGDEFAVLTSLAGSDEAAAAARRLETIVAEQAASVTFGWAVYPADGTDALALFHAADKRLYEGKLTADGRPTAGLLQRVS